MKNLKLFVATLALGAVMTSCSSTIPVTATSNPLGSKVGMSKGRDRGIAAAAKNGGITKISTVDFRVVTFFGLPISMKTVVTGE